MLKRKTFPTGPRAVAAVMTAAAMLIAAVPLMTTGGRPARAELIAEAQAATAPDRAFAAMLARLKAGNTDINFTQLRMLWTRTSAYRPNAAVDDEQPMRAAFAAGRNQEVLRLADKVLKEDYLNILSHMLSADAHGALGNSEARQFHVFVARGLIRSLLQSGDGLSPKTAYKVVSITEIGRVLFFRSLRPTGESTVVREGGRIYRKVAVKREQGGGEGAVFFDVTPLETAGAAKPAGK